MSFGVIAVTEAVALVPNPKPRPQGSVAVLLRTHPHPAKDNMATAPQPLSDETLMERVQGGDRVAFATLVERHSRKYYALAFGLLQDPQEAKDMVQTAFLKLWQQPHHFDLNKQTRFTTWFYRVVLNLCLDFKKKHREHLPKYTPEGRQESHFERDQNQAQQRYWLRQQLQTLPQNQQTALQLCFYQGLSNQEAAQVMGISLKALQSLLVRARKKLSAAAPRELIEEVS